MPERLTWRQLRLIDWMRAPQHPDLPQGPAIDYTNAMWTVHALVRLSGVCEHYTYAKCRRDLDALDAHGLVGLMTDEPRRWKVGMLP